MAKYLASNYAHVLGNEINFSETQASDAIFAGGISEDGDGIDDALYEDAKQAVLQIGKASTSYLQRKLRIGYSRAARLMDLLEENGIIGPADGARPREVLGPGGTDAAISSKRAEADEDAEETDR